MFNEEIKKDICNLFINGSTIKDIAKIYNYSKDTISRVLKQFKLSRTNLTNQEIVDIVKFYQDLQLKGLPKNFLKLMSLKFNRSKSTIANLLNSNSIRITNGVKKYYCNESYFKRIDSADKAYWLGFIAADGNVFRHCLHIGIHENDFHHLELFKSHIEATNPVRIMKYKSKGKDSKIARIDLYSKILINDLKSHGIVSNKTFTLDWNSCTKNIKQEYIVDFVRGFFDGDGSWKGTKEVKFFIGCANLNFLSDLQKWLYNYIDLKTNNIYSFKKNTFYTLEKGGINNIIKIYNKLYYNNCIKLLRKFLKCENFIRSHIDYKYNYHLV